MSMELSLQAIAVSGFILDTIGKLMVAYTSVMVHHRFRHEHKVDEQVFTAMKNEQVFGFAGMVLIVVGASMELWAMVNLA